MIRVRNLTRVYTIHKKAPGLMGSVSALFYRKKEEKHALKGIDLDVKEGEILGLVGANGAGKTTLVKILAGIIYPTTGDVDVLGYRPWERKDDFRRQIALIMGQKAQLWWDLPAADSFLLLREIYTLKERDYRRHLDLLVDMLGVGHLMNVQIRRLSLGERMKMELIAALLHEPRVVYLDEPTIGLDLTSQKAIRRFILQYREEKKPAMILTSHYMEDIESLCQRIAVMREGNIVYDGDLSRLMAEFGSNRVITANLLTRNGKIPSRIQLPEKIGELRFFDEGRVKIHVHESHLSETINTLMQKYRVRDLNIDGEELGSIIEAIMNGEEKK